MSNDSIIQKFNAAALRYNAAADAQKIIAERFVAWTSAHLVPNDKVLDLGCGTGFVSAAIMARWPKLQMWALDHSAAMLQQVHRHFPNIHTVHSDAYNYEPQQKFDAIFSSMALHWLPDPRASLQKWQGWIKPQGRLFVALPCQGSFHQWQTLCATHNIHANMWPLPDTNFAKTVANKHVLQDITMNYASAYDFLRSMKLTGAITPPQHDRPMTASVMRRILKSSARPFPVSYKIIFLEVLAKSDP